MFPGQGAQFRAMGETLLKENSKGKERLERISDQLDVDFNKILQEGSDEDLKNTRYSQPAITLIRLTALELLLDSGHKPSGCAGFSLGEFSAMASAGVLSIDETLDLVTKRGLIMDQVCRKISSAGMAAVIGLNLETIQGVLKSLSNKDVYAVNINSPNQTVLAGTQTALAEAEEKLVKAGARRVISLKVAGPFHSPLMNEAALAFKEVSNQLEWKNPVLPLFSNVTGELVSSGNEAKKLIQKHIISPVLWTKIEENLLKMNPDRCLEVGPGKVLAGLWKAVSREIPCLPAGTYSNIKGVEYGV